MNERIHAGAIGAGSVLFTLAIAVSLAGHARPAPGPRELVFEAAPIALGGDPAFATAWSATRPKRAGSRDTGLRPSADAEIPPETDDESFGSLLELASWYQERQQHDAALVVLAQARHLARVETGFYSQEQVEVTERMIASLVATQRYAEADELQEALARLARKQVGDDEVGLVPALRTLGDWKLASFHREVRSAGESGSNPFESEREGRQRAFDTLHEARSAYLEAINLLVEADRYADESLQALEQGLVETYFLDAYRENILEDPDDYLASRRRGRDSIEKKPGIDDLSTEFRNGEDAYIRMLSYQKNDPDATIEDFSENLVRLGDWYLLFGLRGEAIDKYEQAYRLLDGAGAAAATRKLLNPALPVQLPGFTPMAYTAATIDGAPAEAYDGYIDLSFRLNRYGRASHIETLEASPEADAAIEHRLLWMIRDAQFRPRFEEATPVERDTIRARYYYRVANLAD